MSNLKRAQNAIEKTKRTLIAKAKKNGLHENFGQDEVRHFLDTLGGDPYGTEDERKIDREIFYFGNLCAEVSTRRIIFFNEYYFASK